MIKKRVFISGSNSDIGIELCHKYLEENYTVFAHYHKNVQKFDIFEKFNSNLIPLKCNFLSINETQDFLNQYQKDLSDIDCYVHLASIIDPASFMNVDARQALDFLNANVVSDILLTQTISTGMISRNFGRILRCSSIGVKYGGGTDSYAYSFSKHALEFIPSVAKNWAEFNVFVNNVRIGVTDTKGLARFPEKDIKKRVQLIPAKRMAKPKEIAHHLYQLASEENMFISGQTISVSGGE